MLTRRRNVFDDEEVGGRASKHTRWSKDCLAAQVITNKLESGAFKAEDEPQKIIGSLLPNFPVLGSYNPVSVRGFINSEKQHLGMKTRHNGMCVLSL